MKAQDIERAEGEALAACAAAGSADALEAVRVQYLGRKGLLPALMKGLKTLAPEERSAAGRADLDYTRCP